MHYDEFATRLLSEEISIVQRIFARTVQSRSGECVFVAGEYGSGRSTALRILSERLSEEKTHPVVLHGSLDNGDFVSSEVTDKNDLPKKLSALVGETLPWTAPIVTGVVSGNPFASVVIGIVAQLIKAGVAAHDVVESHRAALENPEAWLGSLAATLQQASQKRPVVCVLDDLDILPGGWWSELVLSIANTVLPNSPILLVLGVRGPSMLGLSTPDESPSISAARLLKARGKAEWLYLWPRTRSMISFALGPAERQVIDRLARQSEGRYGLLTRLWHEWKSTNVVVLDWERRWVVLSPDKVQDPIMNPLVYHHLERLRGPSDVDEMVGLWRLLGIAALSGEEFIAEAVAEVIGWERDDLIDLLDDFLVQTNDNPDGFLQELGSIALDQGANASEGEGSGIVIVWRYAFISRLYSSTFVDALPAADRSELSLSLAYKLAEYAAEDGRALTPMIIRLAAQGGDRDLLERVYSANLPDARFQILQWQAACLALQISESATIPDSIAVSVYIFLMDLTQAVRWTGFLLSGRNARDLTMVYELSLSLHKACLPTQERLRAPFALLAGYVANYQVTPPAPEFHPTEEIGRKYLVSSLCDYRSIRSRLYQGIVWHELALNARKIKSNSKSMRLLNIALAIFREEGNIAWQFAALVNLVALCKQSKNMPLARAYAEQAQALDTTDARGWDPRPFILAVLAVYSIHSNIPALVRKDCQKIWPDGINGQDRGGGGA